jgi:aminoglycoside phosphotransferase (APT) family kinase protein
MPQLIQASLSDRREALTPLLHQLAAHPPEVEDTWQGWNLQRVHGGQNGLVYRAERGSDNLAIKFTPRDERDRAGREYASLSLLHEVRPDLAPQPLLLERTLPLPAVVQTWLEGEVHAAPPADEPEWQALLEHLLRVHQVAPGESARSLQRGVVCVTSAQEGLARLDLELSRTPVGKHPREVLELRRRLGDLSFLVWQEVSLGLCRVDPNTLNFIRRPIRWASVDWENSGWGDPAFDLADLTAHPAYTGDYGHSTPWMWVLDTYSALQTGEEFRERTRIYHLLSLAWWAAFFARMVREVALDPTSARWAKRPERWTEQVSRKYARYLALTHEAADRF